MSDTRQEERGRVNQKNRTREAIIEAGATLLRRGGSPAVPEVATEARVSPATAYRYFPTRESLLTAIVEREMRSAVEVLERRLSPTGNATEDVERVALAIYDEISVREREHRSLLRLSLDRWFEEQRPGVGTGVPDRGGRIAFIVEALEPLRARLGEAGLFRLSEALSLAIGIEAHLVLRDMWGLSKLHAAEIVRWTCHALIRQALLDARRNNGEAPPPVSPAAKSALQRSRGRRAVAAGGR